MESEKLEAQLYNLTLKCTSELLQRFSDYSIPLLHNLTAKVLNSKLSVFIPPFNLLLDELENLPLIIIDGVFGMVGQLPNAYSSLKIDPSNYLNLGSVITYLETKSSLDLNLSKRIPVLLHKWNGFFSTQIKPQIIQTILQVIQSITNYVIRYECCMCLKAILKSDKEIEMNFIMLSDDLIPIIIDLLERFKNPQAVWGLIELIKLLFTRSQHAIKDDNLVGQLQNQNILNMAKLDDQLLRPAIIDMFKTVIAAFPYGTVLTSIFAMCIELIDFHFQVIAFL